MRTAPALCVEGYELPRKNKEYIRTFIAQQAAPVPLAAALPGDVAGPVDASRKQLTFVTELALPAVVTPVGTQMPKRVTINHLPAPWKTSVSVPLRQLPSYLVFSLHCSCMINRQIAD